MKINFDNTSDLVELKSNVLVSFLTKNYVEKYFKENGRCKCGNDCKCGDICNCEKTFLQQAIYTSDFKGESKEVASVSNSCGKIIFIGLGNAEKTTCFEKLGETLYKVLKANKVKKASVLFNAVIEYCKINYQNENFYVNLVDGFLLSSYDFTKYMQDEKAKDKKNLIEEITFLSADAKKLESEFKEKELIAKNVFLCRDLQNEPANVLYPESYVELIKKEFKGLNVEIEVFDEKKLKEMGAGSLLSVGQGSTNPSYMVTLKYNGGGSEKPIAFVGKGVCFDSGGLSLKPSGSMEMKMDMSGSAVVVSLLKLLAERKAKVNAVGTVALVENMPSGSATRVQDIVKSMSGQTIEILNTDAEGRMILADALYYTATTFEPQTMIDLATLTGAICIALGDEYTGLFTNNDELENELKEAGEATGEESWRMPLGKIGCDYDKLIDSDWADMKNVGGKDAGSITAAQFLQRFIAKNTKWAHLDIAATAWVSKAKYFVNKGATGWGVRVLNELVKNKYEK